MERAYGNCGLDGAIKHLDELLGQGEFPCNECRAEHEQLRGWLVSLQSLEQRYQQLEQVARDMYRCMDGVLNRNWAYTLPADTDNFRDQLEALGVSLDD